MKFEIGSEIWWVADMRDGSSTIRHGKVDMYLKEYNWYVVTADSGEHRVKSPLEMFSSYEKAETALRNGVKSGD